MGAQGQPRCQSRLCACLCVLMSLLLDLMRLLFRTVSPGSFSLSISTIFILLSGDPNGQMLTPGRHAAEQKKKNMRLTLTHTHTHITLTSNTQSFSTAGVSCLSPLPLSSWLPCADSPQPGGPNCERSETLHKQLGLLGQRECEELPSASLLLLEFTHTLVCVSCILTYKEQLRTTK